MLRVFFKFKRRLLGDLCRCAERALLFSLEAAAGTALEPGIVAVIQTFGDRINFHPHLHFLVTEGGVDEAGAFRKVGSFDHGRIAEVFSHEVLGFLVGKELLSPEWAERLSFLEREGKVSYRYGQDGAERQMMDYLEFVARVVSHIPDKGQVTIRYYGLYGNAHRGKARKAGLSPFLLRMAEEEESRRPRHVRLPQTPAAVGDKILELRTRYPRWGKKKLVVLLGREGFQVSASTVGRVMNRLKARGVLVEPLNVTQAKLARKCRRKPRYAIRKPKDYRIGAPGDLVEVDTLQIRLVPDEIRYQLSARDVVTRFDAIRAYKHQSSLKAAHFLHCLRKKFPSPSTAIQIDGGSEFKGQFEDECQAKKIPLFVLPPRSPKLNGHLERSNRTPASGLTNPLDYLTPDQYYRQWKRDSRRKALPM